jgi:hypothetical protein
MIAGGSVYPRSKRQCCSQEATSTKQMQATLIMGLFSFVAIRRWITGRGPLDIDDQVQSAFSIDKLDFAIRFVG